MNMSTTDQFLLALQAYQEIQAELRQEEKPGADPTRNLPADNPAPSQFGVPDGSLLLGMAEDGLPVMLDLYDPAPGPILVAGDGGSGKTAVLQSIARSTNLQDPGDIQFGVLTPFPEEWETLEAQPNCMGIWPAYHSSARKFLEQIVSWAEVLPEGRQTVLVLLDGLDLLSTSGFQAQHDLRWLLMYGPERQVWPVVTVNPGRLAHLESWLDYFQTRILGQVKRPQTTRLLVYDPTVNLATLFPGSQFGLSQPNGWLKFWLPPLDM
jgi:hypothetical protein